MPMTKHGDETIGDKWVGCRFGGEFDGEVSLKLLSRVFAFKVLAFSLNLTGSSPLAFPWPFIIIHFSRGRQSALTWNDTRSEQWLVDALSPVNHKGLHQG